MMNKAAKKKTTSDSAEVQLAQIFHRNGCMRLPDETRQLKEGHTKYKKGYEIRLVAETKTELNQIRRLLKQLGFTPGSPYEKGYQIVQPIYGKEAAVKFGEILLSHEEADYASGLEWLKNNRAFMTLIEAQRSEKKSPAPAKPWKR
jgi:hypothetical protein